MIPCVIDRNKWARFVPERDEIVGGIPMLENNRGNRCCLGFAVLAIHPDAPIRDVGLPSELCPGERICNIESNAVGLNDEPDFFDTSGEQEQAIKELFATVGLQVSFIN